MEGQQRKRKRVKPNRGDSGGGPQGEAGSSTSSSAAATAAPTAAAAAKSARGSSGALPRKHSLFEDDDGGGSRGDGGGSTWGQRKSGGGRGGGLLDEDDDGDAPLRITVNRDFAARHAHNKKREELQRLEQKYGPGALDDGSDASSSSTEDEDAEALTRTVERDFFSTLAKLKAKDPALLKPDAVFFKEPPEDEPPVAAAGAGAGARVRGKKEKPFSLRDHERRRLETKGVNAFVSDDEDNDGGGGGGGGASGGRPLSGRSQSLAFDEEQRKLRSALIKSIHGDGDGEGDAGSGDGDGDDDSDDDDLLSVRKKTSQEEEEDDADYHRWLQDEGALEQNEAEELQPLRRFWTDPNLSETDRFLRDYITQRKWKSDDFGRDDVAPRPARPQPAARAADAGESESGGGAAAAAADDEGRINLSEDEEEVERQEQYERAYNFRFEEEGAAEIQSFPRDVEGSLRKKKTKRAEQRQRAAERREEEKAAKAEEIKRLKNLKKQEIMDKLRQLQELSGHPAGGVLENVVDLEGEFDPEAHDKQMAAVFDDAYYEVDEDAKPVFLVDEWGEEDDDYFPDADAEGWANVSGGGSGWGGAGEGDGDGDEGNAEEGYAHEVGFSMDADDVDGGGGGGGSSGGGGGGARPKLTRTELKRLEQRIASGEVEAAAAENPVLQRQLEEYFELDYEDIVGGIPTRFKYRTVEPNDYGLTAEEILAAEDKELNQWASLKKMVQYRSEEEERRDKRRYKKRKTDLGKKREVFAASQAWAVTEKGTKIKESEPDRIRELARERKLKRIEARAKKREEKRRMREQQQGEVDAAEAGAAAAEGSGGKRAEVEGSSSAKTHKERRREEREHLRRAFEEKVARESAASGGGAGNAGSGSASGDGSDGKGDGDGGSSSGTPHGKPGKKKPSISAERLRAYETGGVKIDRERIKSAAERKAGKAKKRDKKTSKKRGDAPQA